MRDKSICHVVFLTLMAVLLCQRTGSSQDQLEELLQTAKKELQAAKLPEKEIAVRLKVIENVAELKAYYPHADGGRPEYRNPEFWKPNNDGSYIPAGKPTEAIRDLWETESGVRCAKLSALVMLKATIDTADPKQIAELDEMLRGKVIPNELPKSGIGTLFMKPDPKHGKIFETEELLAGDEIWFDNPYFDRLSDSLKRKYVGQEGHHVFYVGNGMVMDMYSREPLSVEDFRKTFFHWKSVKIAAKREKGEPKASDFQIKSIRRIIVSDD
jgi:hypothetical protein